MPLKCLMTEAVERHGFTRTEINLAVDDNARMGRLELFAFEGYTDVVDWAFVRRDMEALNVELGFPARS